MKSEALGDQYGSPFRLTVHVDKGSVTLNPLSGKGKWKRVIVTAGHTATQKGSKAPTVKKAPVSSTPPF